MQYSCRRGAFLNRLGMLSCLLLVVAVPSHGQNSSGTLLGHVKDPTGAAVVGAQVAAGRHEPPWAVGESLKRRRLNVARNAKRVERAAVAVDRWAQSHPPALPI